MAIAEDVWIQSLCALYQLYRALPANTSPSVSVSQNQLGVPWYRFSTWPVSTPWSVPRTFRGLSISNATPDAPWCAWVKPHNRSDPRGITAVPIGTLQLWCKLAKSPPTSRDSHGVGGVTQAPSLEGEAVFLHGSRSPCPYKHTLSMCSPLNSPRRFLVGICTYLAQSLCWWLMTA